MRVWAIGLGTVLAPLDTSVNIAFPAISHSLDLTIGDVQWLVISYVLTYAALMLALGRAGDLIGHAVVFRAGLAWSIVRPFWITMHWPTRSSTTKPFTTSI